MSSTVGAVVHGVEELVDAVQTMGQNLPSFEGRIISCEEEILALIDAVETKLEGLINDLSVVKRALQFVDESPASKLQVPEPKLFEGIRSSKELENFL